jgi:hypothetical protein
MKKNLSILLLLATCLCFPTSVTAQRLRFGLKAGAGFAKMDYQPDNAQDTFSIHFYSNLWHKTGGAYRPSFLLGGVVEYDVSKDFLLSSGVQLSSRSSKVEVSEMYSSGDYRFSVYQVQVPLNLHYRLKRFFFGAGGYFSSAFAGQYKHVVKFTYPIGGVDGTEDSDNLKFGNDLESNLQRFDFGLRGELGIGLKRTRLSVAFEQGFVNGLPKEFGAPGQQRPRDAQLRNQTITASLVYYWLAK